LRIGRHGHAWVAELVVSAASHAVYGWVTAIVYAILNLGRRG
jgi:hypothetical protein